MILDKIYSHKLKEVEEAKKLVSIESLREGCKGSPQTGKFSRAIRRDNGIKFIAEVKKASPSAGIIREDFNHVKSNFSWKYLK